MFNELWKQCIEDEANLVSQIEYLKRLNCTSVPKINPTYPYNLYHYKNSKGSGYMEEKRELEDSYGFTLPTDWVGLCQVPSNSLPKYYNSRDGVWVYIVRVGDSYLEALHSLPAA
jgi:hypothetical protein